MKKNLQGNGKEEQQNTKGRQVITLNLAITFRVTLVGIFKILSHPLYIYIIFEKVFFIQNRLLGAFETGLFSYKGL